MQRKVHLVWHLAEKLWLICYKTEQNMKSQFLRYWPMDKSMPVWLQMIRPTWLSCFKLKWRPRWECVVTEQMIVLLSSKPMQESVCQRLKLRLQLHLLAKFKISLVSSHFYKKADAH